MKKWLAGGVILILLLSIACLYVFIPARADASIYTVVKCSSKGAFRAMSQESFWKEMSGKAGDGTVLRISGLFFQRVTLVREKDGRSIEGSMQIVPLGPADSISIGWDCVLPSSINPLKRIARYKEAKEIKRSMADVMTALRVSLGDQEKVYGLKIKDTVMRDTALVTTQWVSASYPSTPAIYEKLGLLRSYIAEQGARATNHPMLNAAPEKDGRFRVMVAIPVDRYLKGNAAVSGRRFISWKILTGETKGGAASAEQALAELKQYMSDIQRTAMSIPFQSLVTERDREADTSKWVTRVMVPVN